MQDSNDIGQERYSIGKAAKYLGVSIDTLRRWEKKGKIMALRSPGGHRYFIRRDLDNLFGSKYERVDQPQTNIQESSSPMNTVIEDNLNETQAFDNIQFAQDAPPPPPFYPASPVQVSSPETNAQASTFPPSSDRRDIPSTSSQEVLIPQNNAFKASRDEQNIPAKPLNGYVPETSETISSKFSSDETATIPPPPILLPTKKEYVDQSSPSGKEEKLTERQKQILSTILKDNSKKKLSQSSLFKYIVISIIILAIINLTILYFWSSSSSFVSPIP
jgi:excisionase family DNA binding protein